MAKGEVLIKKTKYWKLTKVKVSGNYVVYYGGDEYIHAKKVDATRQTNAIDKVMKNRKRRKK